MTDPTRWTNLRNLLAELYPDEASMRRLLADAGIPAGRITLGSSAVNNWHDILTEAEKSGKAAALLAVALAEYGDNPHLRAAVTAYQHPIPAAALDPPPVPAPLASSSPPASLPIDIFLSYSRSDTADMHRLRDALQAAGFSVWIDDLNLEPGTPRWQRAVETAIHAARCMVVILSPAAKNSVWVGRELSYAEALGRPIFPVLVSGEAPTAIPISLIDHQRVDLRAGWQPVAERLVPALRRQLPRSSQTPVQQPHPNPPQTREGTVKGSRGGPLLAEGWGASPRSTDKQPDRRWLWGIGLAALLLLLGVSLARVAGLRFPFGAVGQTTNPPAAAAIAPTDPPATPTATPSPGLTVTAAALSVLQTAAAATQTANALTATPAPTLTATPTPLATATPTATSTSTLGVGSTWTNPKDGTIYVYVPAGQFRMGSSDADNLAQPDEKPQRTVTLDAFWIMQTEVTNAQYKQCVEAEGCTPPANEIWNKEEYAQHPVTHVDWNQASAYAQWVGGALPTEAQWEKAARGPKGFIYPWGNEWHGDWLDFCDKNCRFDHKDPDANDGYAQTAPVDSYPEGAGPYGVLNMAGNVWEWVAGWYAADYYATAPAQNPPGPETGEYRSLRGGSWFNQRDNVRAAGRHRNLPAYQFVDLGFRVVRLSSPGP